MVDVNHVSPKVPPMTVEKGQKLKHGSKVVFTQIHEKPKSMLPLERPSLDSYGVHASTSTTLPISQQHLQLEAQNLSEGTMVVSSSSQGL